MILITVDTLRADRLSCYGYQKRHTPNIDRLAADGVLFERAFCDVTWATPSMASVMTGTYATIHRFKSTAVNRLSADALTLAEVLKQHGYATGAVVGSFPLDSIYQLDQGFDSYDDHFTSPLTAGGKHSGRPLSSTFYSSPRKQAAFAQRKAFRDSRRSDKEVTDAATKWLRAHVREKFFLWVHYFGPHAKPDSRLSFKENVHRNLAGYDPDVATSDREVGRLLASLDKLGVANRTLVVLHADHGESLLEHGTLGHGDNLYEQALRIPLLMRFPGRIPQGGRIPHLVRNVDIFPTVLDALGLPVPDGISGESLWILACLGAGRHVRETYMETYFPAHRRFAHVIELRGGKHERVGIVRRGVRTTRWKFIRSEPWPLFGFEENFARLPSSALDALRREELYDLAQDPGESRNVLDERPAVAKDLRRRLAKYRAAEGRSVPAPVVTPDAVTRERLRSLGYGD